MTVEIAASCWALISVDLPERDSLLAWSGCNGIERGNQWQSDYSGQFKIWLYIRNRKLLTYAKLRWG